METTNSGDRVGQIGKAMTGAGCALVALPIVLILTVLLIAFMVAAFKAATGG